MKKHLYLVISLLFGAMTLLQAQAIREGDCFFDGSTLYSVREIRLGNIIYLADARGEEELTLEQWGDTPGVYRLRPSRNADEPKYGAEFGCRVEYISQLENKFLRVIGDNDMILKESGAELLSHLVPCHLDISEFPAGFVLFLLVFFVLLSLRLVAEVSEDIAELYASVVVVFRRRNNGLHYDVFCDDIRHLSVFVHSFLLAESH